MGVGFGHGRGLTGKGTGPLFTGTLVNKTMDSHRSRSRLSPSSRSGRSRSRSGRSVPSTPLASYLRQSGISAGTYLARARTAARRTGYPSSRLSFSDDGVHKLQIETPEGRVRRFGRVGYGDFIIWTSLERAGQVAKGYANQKRHVFRTSHGALSRQRGITDRYAPNNLAINILW